jgi:hypothetical protein
MSTAKWFDIECVEGGAATLYLAGAFTPEHVAALREVCDALPPSVRTLRVQLGANPDDCLVLKGIRELLRHWRLSRGSSFHLLLTRPSAPQNARSASPVRTATSWPTRTSPG